MAHRPRPIDPVRFVGPDDPIVRAEAGPGATVSRRVGAVNAAARGGAAAVIVTDGETRPALAAVRSLGAHGLPVHVIAASPSALAGASRFATALHVVPSPEDEPAAWAEAVARIAASLPGALVLPVTEVALGSAFAFGLEGRVALAAPPREAYARAVDKHALVEDARACGIPVPRSVLVEALRSLDALPPGFAFPVVLKARRSRWLEGGRWRRGAVRVLRDPAALRQAWDEPAFAAGALLQEWVPGAGAGLFFLFDRGRPRVRFAHRRLREKPPSGGVSVLCEAVLPDPQLAAWGELLLARLGWHGVAMVEFRRASDGRAWLMEVNPRLWGSLQLAIDAGADFPALLVALERGEPLPPIEPRVGLRSRWALGDLDHLLIALRDPAQRAATGRGRLRVLRDFLRGFVDGSRSEILRRSDPRPFVCELQTWLRGR